MAGLIEAYVSTKAHSTLKELRPAANKCRAFLEELERLVHGVVGLGRGIFDKTLLLLDVEALPDRAEEVVLLCDESNLLPEIIEPPFGEIGVLVVEEGVQLELVSPFVVEVVQLICFMHIE